MLENNQSDFEIEEMEAGDEFMAVKPWLGAIKAPDGFEESLNVSKQKKPTRKKWSRRGADRRDRRPVWGSKHNFPAFVQLEK